MCDVSCIDNNVIINKNLVVNENLEVKKRVLLGNKIAISDTNVNINASTLINSTFFSENTISIHNVIDSMNGFKEGLYIIYYVYDLIKKNKDLIINEGKYNTILGPLIDKKFGNIFNSSSRLFIETLNLNEPNAKEDTFYYYTYNHDIENIPINDIPNEELKNLIINARINTYKKLIDLINSNKNDIYITYNYYPYINGISINFKLLIRDILNNDSWIEIGYAVNIQELYFKKVIFNDKISNDYTLLLNNIEQIMNNPDNFTNTIWEYGIIQDFNKLKCIESTLYPYWNNLYIQECFIKGSNQNIPNIIKNIIYDLNLNYPELENGQVIFTNYSMLNINYVAIVKIILINQKLCFQINEININNIFETSLLINGDTKIKGSLSVESYNGEKIITTDNERKIITFNEKVGINQQPFEIEALLDIDNLSIQNIYNILNKFASNLLDSYNIINICNQLLLNNSIDIIFNEIIFNDINNNSLRDYKNEFFSFKIPIKSVIKEEDISFIYIPKGLSILDKQKFDTNSFNRIAKISNELCNMNKEFANKPDFIFSFLELLNDTDNNYLVSMKGVLINNNSEMLFIVSFLNVDEYIIDLSYSNIFINIINGFSNVNKMVNYTTLIIYNEDIFNQIINNNDSINSITKYIEDGNFRNRFNLTSNYTTMINIDIPNKNYINNYNELHPTWNGLNIKDINSETTDTNMNNFVDIIIQNRIKQFGGLKLNQNFFSIYEAAPFSSINSLKVSFGNYFIKNSKIYYISSGINLNDYIDQSIIAKGDVKFQGDFSISDSNDRKIFEINTVNKTIGNVYKVGIGNVDPKATLDVEDSGIDDINAVILVNSEIFNNLNKLVEELKKALSEDDFINIIDKLYPNQTKDNYIACDKINKNTLLAKDTKIIYHFLLKEWQGQYLKDIIDYNNLQLLNIYINNFTDILNNNLIFENSSFEKIYNWKFGIKKSNGYFFMFQNEIYIVSSGINLQNYSLRINTNNNVLDFFNYQSNILKIINNIEIRQRKIEIQNIINYQKSLDEIQIILQIYKNIVNNTLYVIEIKDDIYQSIISNFNFDTLEITNPIILNKLNEYNKIVKFLSFITNTKLIYNTLKIGNYGITVYEDLYNDFVGSFIIIDINGVLKILFIETQINNIIKPAVDIRGDTRIKGDLIVTNSRSGINYASIDPEGKFVGINTDDRYTNYKGIFSTSSSSSIINSKNHVVISNNTNPNLVCERFADYEGNEEIKNFRSYSAATIRRSSRLYTFKEMYEKTKENANPAHLAKYGAEISSEIQDKNGFTVFMQNFGTVIHDLDKNDNPRSAFVVRTYPVKDDGTYDIPRPMLYLDPDGTLNVENINVGKISGLSQTTEPSNITVDTVSLTGSKYKLYVKKEGEEEVLMWGNKEIARQ